MLHTCPPPGVPSVLDFTRRIGFAELCYLFGFCQVGYTLSAREVGLSVFALEAGWIGSRPPIDPRGVDCWEVGVAKQVVTRILRCILSRTYHNIIHEQQKIVAAIKYTRRFCIWLSQSF